MISYILAVALLSADFNSILSDVALEGAIPGTCIMTMDEAIVYQRHAGIRLVPASNQKILTAVYAIATLGVDFRQETRFWKEENRVFVDAPGDPTISMEQLVEAREALGIGEDAAIYVRQAYRPVVPPSWEYDDLPHRYGARVTALSFDYAGFEIWAEDGKLRQLDPAYRITLRHIPGAERVRTTYWPEKRLAVVRGRLPSGTKMIEAFAMPDPDVIAARLLGGTIVHTDEAPPEREPDYVIRAEPLKLILKDCLEISNNNIAEHLLLMSATHSEPFGENEYSEAADRMRTFMEETVGLVPGSVRPVDGSGLSRHNLIAPRAMCGILAWAYSQPWRDDFMEALAAPGEGTMKSRLKASTFVGKTGTLSAVVALSGYVEAADGRILTVCLLFNHTIVPAREVRAVQDRVIRALEREVLHEVGTRHGDVTSATVADAGDRAADGDRVRRPAGNGDPPRERVRGGDEPADAAVDRDERMAVRGG